MSRFDFQGPTNLSEAFEFKDLSKPVKEHVTKVYAHLTGLMVVSILGCVFGLRFNFGGMGSSLLAMICFFYLMFSDSKSQARLPVLGAFGFLKGISLAPLISVAIAIDPSLVLTSLLATTCIFTCFSLAAYWADKRLHIYLAGFLSAGIMISLLFAVISLFGIGRELAFHVNLYLGLFIFMGYVVYDTQVMVARVERGIKDPIKDALQLFIDFVAIFVRILIILMKNKKKDRD